MSEESDGIDYKKIIAAALLSIVIVFGWQLFVIDKDEGRRRPANSDGVQGFDNSKNYDAVNKALSEARNSEKIEINSDTLHGSMSLRGGRIDALQLYGYSETLDEESLDVSLFRPSWTSSPYYSVFGWSSKDKSISLPGSATEWVAVNPTDRLSPSNPVEMTWDNGAGLRFFRTVSLDDKYMFTVSDRVENYGDVPVTLVPYSTIVRKQPGNTNKLFILHEGLIGMFKGALHEVRYDEAEDFPYSSIDDSYNKSFSVDRSGWLGFTDKYWMSVIISQGRVPATAVMKMSRSSSGYPIYITSMRYGNMLIDSDDTVEFSSMMFAGPKEVSTIKGYQDEYGVERFIDSIDWGWFFFLTKPIFSLLTILNDLLGNFGVAIIFMTLIVKILFYPLSYKSFVSMSSIQKLQPEIKQLQEKYRDDKEALQRAMMQMYKDNKVNPVSGCLPVLLQIPVFFSLYKVLFVTIEMRHAPFFGWIKDLAAPDPTSIFNLFGLLPFTLPDVLTIGVWPCMMGITMFLQQQLMPAVGDSIQRKVMSFLPLVFTIMLAHFPSGLVIYWTTSNVLTIVQQVVNMKRGGVQITLHKNIIAIIHKIFKRYTP